MLGVNSREGKSRPFAVSEKNIVAKDILKKKYFHQKYFFIYHQKYFQKKYFWQIFFQKKGVGEAPLLPAGPRLKSSDSEISA